MDSKSCFDSSLNQGSSADKQLPPLPPGKPPGKTLNQLVAPPLPPGPPPTVPSVTEGKEPKQTSRRRTLDTHSKEAQSAIHEKDSPFKECLQEGTSKEETNKREEQPLFVGTNRAKPRYDRTKGLESYDPRGGARACRQTLEHLCSLNLASNLTSQTGGTQLLGSRKRKFPGEQRLGLSFFHRRTVDAYEIIQQVGAGTFGEVYKARDRVSGHIVALKKTHVHNEKEGFPLTALREIKILQNLKHVNVVDLIDIVPSKASPKDSDLGVVFLVFEYLDNDLTGLLENPNIKLTEAHVKCYMKQLLEGLHYIHTNNVIHRDIKAANLLISNNGYLKIGDWGLSRSWIPGNVYTTRVVTLWYRAPELLLGVRTYTPAIDMWAAGCIFAELLSKKSILPGKDELSQIKLILQLCGTPKLEDWPQFHETEFARNTKLEIHERSMEKRFSWMPATALNLLKGLLTMNPTARLTAAEALDHDYFWQGSVPCKPEQLPKLGGEGLHEYELKANMHKNKAKSYQRTNKRAYNNGNLQKHNV